MADVYAARALNGYARPQGASPLRVALVPAYEPCTSPDREHGPPLAFGSCAQPQQSSQDLTVGTPDANGQAAASVGFLRLDTLMGNPASPEDEADVAVSLSITDVRESAGLADYTGEVTAALSVRLTDRDGPCDDPGLPVRDRGPVRRHGRPPRAARARPRRPSRRSCPARWMEGSRAIWQLDAVEVLDGSGNAFARQGIFVP